MEKRILKNGLTVIYKKRDSDSVVIQIMVKVGSNYEKKHESGISHFIEHLLFETESRPGKEVPAEIEKLGGLINAFTDNDLTVYFVHVPKKHFDKGLEILSDMIKNPAFRERTIEVERSTILNEAKLWRDDPKLYQWVLMEKMLFKGYPMSNPILGEIDVLKKITREDLLSYYRRYYFPKNMIIGVIGDVRGVFEKAEKAFKNFDRNYSEPKKINVILKNKRQIVKEKRDVEHSYFIMAYKTPTRQEKDSYAFDIIQNILGYGLSSRLMEELRIKRGLVYNVGTVTNMHRDFASFAVYLSTDKKNIEKCKKIILDEFKKLNDLTEKELKEAKMSIDGFCTVKNEDPIKCITEINYWENIKDASLYNGYIKNINKVTLSDVKRVAKQYLNNQYTLILIEQ